MFFLFLAQTAYSRDFTDVELKTIHVSGNIYMLEGVHGFAGMFPFVDIATGGNVLSYADNVKTVIDSVPNDVRIIPGHGALSNKAELITYHKMLQDSIQHVRQNIEQGMTLEELVEAGLPKHLAVWDIGFINAYKWLTLTYQSL